MKYKNISNSLYIKGRIGWKGLKKKEYLRKGDYRIINGSNISNGKINWSDCGYITKQRYFESPEIMLQKGDILVTKDGTIGKVALVEDLVQPSTIASGLFIVRNKDTDECDTLFLYYYLQTRKFKEFIHSRTEGSVIPHLYQKDFKEFKIPDISLANQRQISSKLNYIQKKITLNNQLNDNLGDYINENIYLIKLLLCCLVFCFHPYFEKFFEIWVLQLYQSFLQQLHLFLELKYSQCLEDKYVAVLILFGNQIFVSDGF